MTNDEQEIVRAAVDALTSALLLATKHREQSQALEQAVGRVAKALRELRPIVPSSAWKLTVEGDVIVIDLSGREV